MYNHKLSITRLLGGLIFCCGLLILATLFVVLTEYDSENKITQWRRDELIIDDYASLAAALFFFILGVLVFSGNNIARIVFVVFMHLLLVGSILGFFMVEYDSSSAAMIEKIAFGLLITIPQVFIIIIATHRLTRAECKGTEKEEFPDLLDA